MPSPLVTVICLCYNHARFVREAIESVLVQSYPSVQLIVVDDASTDGSVDEINKILSRQNVEFISLEENIGNCRAFNKGLALAKGEFVIDLAADDVLMADRIEKQVALFQSIPPEYGVVFSDAEYIDEHGVTLKYHFDYLLQKGLLYNIPQGEVYADVVAKYFIPSPTMMMRRSVLEMLGGYDESLAYEDFDFWVRSSRFCKYAFLHERITKIRKSRTSMSAGWYQRGDRQLHSTYLVCKKVQALNREQKEVDALVQRVRFELRQSVFSKNVREAKLFFDLLTEITHPTFPDKLMMHLLKVPLPLPWLRKAYHKLKYS